MSEESPYGRRFDRIIDRFCAVEHPVQMQMATALKRRVLASAVRAEGGALLSILGASMDALAAQKDPHRRLPEPTPWVTK